MTLPSPASFLLAPVTSYDTYSLSHTHFLFPCPFPPPLALLFAPSPFAILLLSLPLSLTLSLARYSVHAPSLLPYQFSPILSFLSPTLSLFPPRLPLPSSTAHSASPVHSLLHCPLPHLMHLTFCLTPSPNPCMSTGFSLHFCTTLFYRALCIADCH